MKRSICFFLVTALLCMLFSGCGDHGNTMNTTTAFTTITTTAPSTTVTTTTTTIPTTVPTFPGNEEFRLTDSQVQELDTLISAYEGNVSVLYFDVGSGYQYQYNNTQKYVAASIIKAPFCLYVLQMAERGETDLEETMEYTEDFYTTGTGIIKKEPYGTVYTKKTLVEYALRYSDNIAFKMLRTAYPPEGFREYAKTIGIQDVNGIKNVSSSNITADDALTYMKEIYKYLMTKSENAVFMEDNMLKTVNPLIRASYPIVRKYGWMKNAFHDIAIIQAPRPYILIILSNHGDGTKEDKKMFEVISKKVESFSGNKSK